MAIFASGKDKSNPALWLATRAGKMEARDYPPYPAGKISPKAIESFIDQVCSVKMAGYWPRSFLRVYGPRLRRGPINTQKKNSSHLDRTNLVNNPHIAVVGLLGHSWYSNNASFLSCLKLSFLSPGSLTDVYSGASIVVGDVCGLFCSP